MSQTMSIPVAYTTTADAIRRHEQGVSKTRKAILTGGGRAWSEDEEAYLLQTRLQKMPYKHIAAHLKKTELACRLHYHQLSHGSSRRKRASSVSSGSDHSSELPAPVPGPMHERLSGSLSPPRRAESYGPVPSCSDMQLPSIMGSSLSPRLPAILPKPASMPTSQTPGLGFRYPSMMHDEPSHLPPVNFHHGPRYQHMTPPPRLEGSPLSLPSTSVHTPTHVDLSRLQAIYDTHRDAFWSVIAHEYGSNMSPALLETAWKTGVCCRPLQSASRPLTPAASPGSEMRNRGCSIDKTRIASILDEDPRGGW